MFSGETGIPPQVLVVSSASPKEGKTTLAPTDQLSTPTYNTDLAAASIALVQRAQTGNFHVAGPDFLSRYDFAVTACKILALPTATLQPITTPELAQPAAEGGLVEPLTRGGEQQLLDQLLGGEHGGGDERGRPTGEVARASEAVGDLGNG